LALVAQAALQSLRLALATLDQLEELLLSDLQTSRAAVRSLLIIRPDQTIVLIASLQ
jgi:hypothetical protein